MSHTTHCVLALFACTTAGLPTAIAQDAPHFASPGAYGYHVRQSLALAYVDTEWCETSDPLSVTILGKPRAARILHVAPYDPAGSILRG